MALLQARFSDRYNFGFFLNTIEQLEEAVEVGTHRGDFARGLLRTWIGRTLYCVDPYLSGYDPDDPASQGDRGDDYRTALEVLAPYSGRYEFIATTSELAAGRFKNRSLSFVYVDGHHRFGSVLADLRIWWPKIRPGGILAGHDFLETGGPWNAEVQPAVLSFAKEVGVDCYLVTEPSMAPWSYYFVKP